MLSGCGWFPVLRAENVKKWNHSSVNTRFLLFLALSFASFVWTGSRFWLAGLVATCYAEQLFSISVKWFLNKTYLMRQNLITFRTGTNMRYDYNSALQTAVSETNVLDGTTASISRNSLLFISW